MRAVHVTVDRGKNHRRGLPIDSRDQLANRSIRGLNVRIIAGQLQARLAFDLAAARDVSPQGNLRRGPLRHMWGGHMIRRMR